MIDTLEHWRAALPALTALLLVLAVANTLLATRARRRNNQLRRTATQTLLYLLGLIQQLQKHRALGGRGDSEASQQRAQLAPALERLWGEWSQHFPDAEELPLQWQQLRRHPADFDAHCRLIDRLLAAMELVEQRAATAGTTPFGARCRVIEDLGQLRGLAVRAAGLARCPVQLEVPLRYLCLRLTVDTPQQQAEPEVRNALREIEQRLLQRQGPALTPGDCFALLTPVIDRALDALRAELQAATSPAARAPLAAPATVPIWSALP